MAQTKTGASEYLILQYSGKSFNSSKLNEIVQQNWPIRNKKFTYTKLRKFAQTIFEGMKSSLEDTFNFGANHT